MVERAGPAGRGKLRYPDHIHEKDVDRGITILQLLRQQIVIGCRGMRRKLAHDRDMRVRLGELGDGSIPHTLMIGLPGDEAEGDVSCSLPGFGS